MGLTEASAIAKLDRASFMAGAASMARAANEAAADRFEIPPEMTELLNVDDDGADWHALFVRARDSDDAARLALRRMQQFSLPKAVARVVIRQVGPEKGRALYERVKHLAPLEMAGLVPLYPEDREWALWNEHYRGTKQEQRMLSAQARCEAFYAPSNLPPEAPRADRITRAPQPAEIKLPERRGAGDGEVNAIADRLQAKAQRDAAEAKHLASRNKGSVRAERVLGDALAAAAQNQRPDVDGSPHLGLIAVADPSEAESLVRVGKGPPMRVANEKAKLRLRVVSLRDDSIGLMAKRLQLGPSGLCDVRLAAARQWQALRERAELSNLRGLDPAYERVDGGVATIDSVDRMDASKRLGEVARVLGIRGENLIRRVLGENRSLREIAALDGVLTGEPKNDKEIIKKYGDRLRDCLDDLAGVFRLNTSAEGKTPPRLYDHWDNAALARSNPRLYDAIGRGRR